MSTFVLNSGRLSEEELGRLCKQADPGAEVLADGKDAAVFVWLPDVLRYRHDKDLCVAGLEESTGVFSDFAKEKAGENEA